MTHRTKVRIKAWSIFILGMMFVAYAGIAAYNNQIDDWLIIQYTGNTVRYWDLKNTHIDSRSKEVSFSTHKGTVTIKGDYTLIRKPTEEYKKELLGDKYNK